MLGAACLWGAGSITGDVAVRGRRAAVCGSERTVEGALARAGGRATPLGLSAAACSVATGRLGCEQQTGLSDLRRREADGAPTPAETADLRASTGVAGRADAGQ